MDYNFEISNFSGPLDLLLHLIKKSDVDICDINIEEIANQYLEYINKLESMNLNIASEYLVMAAELIEIKSSILLPKRKQEDEDEYEEDPKAALINRLIEYERYKNITSSLKNFELERQEIYSKEPYNLEDIIVLDNKVEESFNLEDLIKAMNDALSRKQDNNPLNTKVTNKEYSIVERSNQIRNLLKINKQIQFKDLFDILSKDYIVITFLSVLSMAKQGEIEIKQEKNFDNIVIGTKEGE